MELTFLGTGTSTGVPQLRCGCPTCTSHDPRDRRFRACSLLEFDGRRVLIDCGPDFHQQMLIHGKRSPEDELDALLVTHQHYDHVGGLDDLRPYCYRNGKMTGFPVYCQADVAHDFRERLPYSFRENPYPGSPRFDLHDVEAFRPFELFGREVLPVRVNHFILDMLGYRIGQLGYITDAKQLPAETIEAMRGVDTLVINALRRKPHNSHFSLDDALATIREIKPRMAYLIHISHDMGLYAEVAPTLPTNVVLAFDGLKIQIPD
jgi:phosphoribosyl 1,2-cyclic phosphate phosphodiesterase